MKKFLLPLSALALAAFMAAPTAVAADTPTDGAGMQTITFTWGNKTNPRNDDNRFGYYPMGAGSPFRYVIRVPETYAGGTLKSADFYILDKRVLDDIRFWVAEELPARPESEVPYMIQGDVNAITDMWTDEEPYKVVFDEEYTIPDNGCYVGFDAYYKTDTSGWSAEMKRNRTYPGLSAHSTDKQTPNRSWYTYPYPEETGEVNFYWADMSNAYDIIPTTVVIEGYFLKNAVKVAPQFGLTPVTTLGASKDITLKIEARGTVPVQSITYVVRNVTHGTDSEEHTVTFDDPMKQFDDANLTFTLDAQAEPDLSDLEVEITKVNGEANEIEDNLGVSKGQLVTAKEGVDRRVVLEEWTGMWCMWCPAGITALEEMDMAHPDDCLSIAFHNQDPLVCLDYNDYFQEFNGYVAYPGCTLDRRTIAHSFYGTSGNQSMGIEQDFQAHKNTLSEAGIEIDRAVMGPDKRLHVYTTTTFKYSSAEAEPPYAIAYVVTADGLTNDMKTTSGTPVWVQQNAYGSLAYKIMYAQDPYLSAWTEQPELLTGLSFDHVAVAAKGVFRGVDGTITGPFTVDVPQESYSMVDMSGVNFDDFDEASLEGKTDAEIDEARRTFVQAHPDQLHVTAMLINRRTNQVSNAARADVDVDLAGIDNIGRDADGSLDGEDAAVTARYSIDGRRVADGYRGLVIERLSDGTSRKVMVK